MTKLSKLQIKEITDNTPHYDLPYGGFKLYCGLLINFVIKNTLETYFLLNDIQENKKITKRRLRLHGSIFTKSFGVVEIIGRQVLSYIPGMRHLYNRTALSSLIERHIQRTDDLRRLFDHDLTRIELLRQSKNHTHQMAAALRTSVNSALTNLARRAGYTPFVVSYSASDHKLGTAGVRNYFWPKDLAIPHREDIVCDNTCFIFTDVDYYADMNEYLRKFKPILIYTFSPKTVTGVDKLNGHQYAIVNDVVYYVVSGGGTYSHKLWDYKGDTISIIDNNSNLLTFDITQKELDKDQSRRIITILPRTSTPWPYYLHLNYENGIKYKNITYGLVNILHDPIERILSIGMNGAGHSVEIDAELFVSIHHRILQKSNKSPVIGDIEVMLVNQASLEKEEIDKKKKDGEPKQELAKYLRNTKVTASLLDEVLPWVWHLPHNVVHTTTIPTNYVAIGPISTYEVKPTCVPITTPLVRNPSTAPAKLENNEMAAVNGRVLSRTNNTVPRAEYKVWAREFADLLVPNSSVVTGISYAEVIEIQDKVNQRARAALVFDTLGTETNNSIKSFIKGEGYESMNDPRVISQMRPALTINMSRFTIPFKNMLLKKQPWYAPGNEPDENRKRISEIGRNGLIESDYTRFDGTISKFLQKEVVLPIYTKAIVHHERHQFKSYFNDVFKQKARTESGIPYAAGWGTRSGSPLTTDANTMINAYISFCALRSLGFNKNESWNKLGIYAGDDGLLGREDGLYLQVVEVSAALGLDIKVGEKGPNESVTFCGRIFPHPLTHPDSFQDIKRTLPKLHLTFNKNVDIRQAAYNKAIGYMVTDRMTPLISNWAMKVIELSGISEMKHARDDEYYRTLNTWVQEDYDLIKVSVARELNMTIGELEGKCQEIDDVSGEFPLQMPVVYNNEIKHKLDGRIDDVVITNTGNRVSETHIKFADPKHDTKCQAQMQDNSKQPMETGRPMAKPTSNKRFNNTSIREEHGLTKESRSQLLTKNKSRIEYFKQRKSSLRNQLTPRKMTPATAPVVMTQVTTKTSNENSPSTPKNMAGKSGASRGKSSLNIEEIPTLIITPTASTKMHAPIPTAPSHEDLDQPQKKRKARRRRRTRKSPTPKEPIVPSTVTSPGLPQNEDVVETPQQTVDRSREINPDFDPKLLT